MPEYAEFVELPIAFPIVPEDLMEANKHVPLDADGYVPILIFGREFPKVEPALRRLGAGAIELSLGRPFGFMRGLGEGQGEERSQQTNDMVIEPRPKGVGWRIELKTPERLTSKDIDLFQAGTLLYARYVAADLRVARAHA